MQRRYRIKHPEIYEQQRVYSRNHVKKKKLGEIAKQIKELLQSDEGKELLKQALV